MPCVYCLSHAELSLVTDAVLRKPSQLKLPFVNSLTGDVTAAVTALTQDVDTNMLPFASAAEESDSKQSWSGLFWLPPADDEPAEHDMLRLDDELDGLVEAADTSADEHGTPSTKPGLPPPVPGQTKPKSDAALLAMCCAVLCCAVLCCPVLCCAVLCCAV